MSQNPPAQQRVCFVVPCFGRDALAAICLAQLAATCDALAPEIEATAVLVSDEPAFERLARARGFDHVRQTNQPLGRKWNDGFQRALELGADFVIPFGSDDAVDPALIRESLPSDDTVRCSRLCAVVSEDGGRLAELEITYHMGDGVRTYPAAILRRVGGRPALDERERAIDGSITDNLRRSGLVPHIRYVDVHPLQIVDFKSPAGQLNGYEGCARDFGTRESDTPWADLAGAGYPEAFLEELAWHYGRVPMAVA